MPTLKQLQTALVNADAAGDIDAARAIVTEIQRQQPAAASAGAAQEPVDFSFGEMVKNIPGSLGKLAQDLIQPIIHPIDTATSIGRLALGVGEKLIPGEQEHEKYADQVGQMMADRYGSMDALKTTMMEDPAGFVADLSTVLTGGGMAAARAPGMVGKLGRATQKAGSVLEPINVARNLGKTAIRPFIGKNVPAKIYDAGAGFSNVLPTKQRQALVETALEYDLKPTAKGVGKLEKSMEGLNTKIDAIINAADKSGKTIPSWAVLKHLEKVRKEVGGPKLEATANLKMVDDIAESFVQRMRDIGKSNFTVREMQDWKTDAYDKVRWHPSRPTIPSAKEKSFKAMARGAKESIEAIAPEVKTPNVELGRLLELEKHLQQSAARIGKRNIIPLNAPMHTGIGSMIGGVPGAMTGAGTSFLELPRTKANLALRLHKIRNPGSFLGFADNNPWLTAIRQGMVQTGRLPQEQQ